CGSGERPLALVLDNLVLVPLGSTIDGLLGTDDDWCSNRNDCREQQRWSHGGLLRAPKFSSPGVDVGAKQGQYTTPALSVFPRPGGCRTRSCRLDVLVNHITDEQIAQQRGST